MVNLSTTKDWEVAGAGRCNQVALWQRLSRLPPFFAMAFSWSRILLVLAAFAVVMGLARPASAYAPFCDPLAATSMAPPPFTAIPDLRWEPAMGLMLLQWCERIQAFHTIEGVPQPAKDRVGESHSLSGPDLASLQDPTLIPRRHAAVRVRVSKERSEGPPGVRDRVYRPPR